MLAILTGAIEELSATVLYLRREAADWMVLDNDFIFGFQSICDELEISPSALRKHLAPLIEAGLHEDNKKPSRQALIPHDDNASHEYVSSGHCNECHNRYRTWYKQHGPVKK